MRAGDESPQGWGPSGVGHGMWALRGGAGGVAVCPCVSRRVLEARAAPNSAWRGVYTRGGLTRDTRCPHTADTLMDDRPPVMTP